MGACREWWTDCRNERQWVDLVVPRVLAARLLRKNGDLERARDLLIEAVGEDERYHVLEMTQEGPEATGRLTLWGPGLRELRIGGDGASATRGPRTSRRR